MKSIVGYLGALAVGLTVVLTGCETTGVGVLSTLGQMSPYTTPAEKALWAAAGTAARMEHEKEVAREGRPVYGKESPASSGNDVKCVVNGDEIICTTARGLILWTNRFDGPVEAPVDQSGGTVTVRTARTIYMLHATTGREIWRQQRR